MKLTIEANDFCPDDCVYCKPEETISYYQGSQITYHRWECENKNKCKYAHALKKDEVTE